MQAVGAIPKKKEVAIVEHPQPSLGRDDEALVKSLEVGICGTDREICTFVYGDPPADSDYLVLGHESLGMITEVGNKVEGLKPGDLVVPSVRRPCSEPHCAPCQADLQDFCATGDFVERGIKMFHGFMTEFYTERENISMLCHLSPRCRRAGGALDHCRKGHGSSLAHQTRLPWVKHHHENGKPMEGASMRWCWEPGQWGSWGP